MLIHIIVIACLLCPKFSVLTLVVLPGTVHILQLSPLVTEVLLLLLEFAVPLAENDFELFHDGGCFCCFVEDVMEELLHVEFGDGALDMVKLVVVFLDLVGGLGLLRRWFDLFLDEWF